MSEVIGFNRKISRLERELAALKEENEKLKADFVTDDSREKLLEELTWFGHTIAAGLKAKGDACLRTDADLEVFARAYASGYLSGLNRDIPLDDLSTKFQEWQKTH